MENKISNLKPLLNKHGIINQDRKEFNYAFTHSSYINESKLKMHESYERLEYLGDSIIGKLTAEYLFNKYPEATVSDMSLLRSNVVDEVTLAQIAIDLEFENFTNLGKGEKRNKMPISIYADIFEAFIGAVYLADGEDKVIEILTKHLFPHIDDLDLEDLKDPKTKLQEFLQSTNRSELIYGTKNISKSVSKPFFESSVIHDGIILGIGIGKSKKLAEKQAARNAYTKLVK